MGYGLVQAMMLRKEQAPRQRGLSQYFTFRSHGMAEYEFGAIPKAVQRMRDAYESLVDIEINVHGHRAVVICHPTAEVQVTKFFKDELRSGRQGAAFLYMREAYGMSDDDRPPPYNEVAWFNLSPEIPWVICKTAEVAANWRLGLTDKSKPTHAVKRPHSTGMEIFYSKEDLVADLREERTYDRELTVLRYIDPDHRVSNGAQVFLSLGKTVVAEVVYPYYQKQLVEGLVSKVEDPSLVYLWETVKTETNARYSVELVEEVKGRR